MTFDKRTFIWWIGIISILSLVYVYFFVRLPFSKPAVFEAVPKSSPLLIEWNHTDDLTKWFNEIKINDKFDQVFFVDKIIQNLDTIQSIFEPFPFWKKAQTSGHWLASVNSGSADDWNLLLIVKIPDYKFDIEQLNTNENLSVSYNRYLGEQIYNVTSKKNESIYIASQNGLILMAKYPLMIEDAIRQLKKPSNSIMRESAFSDLVKENKNNKSANVYIQFSQLPLLLSSFVKAEKRNVLDELTGLATWGKLTLDFQQNNIATNFKFSLNEKHHFLKEISSKSNLDLQNIEEILPNNTAIAATFAVGDFASFYNAIQSESSDFWRKELLKQIGSQFTFLITEPYSEYLDTEKFLVFKLKNAKEAEQILEKNASKSGKLKEYTYQSFKVGRLMSGDVLSPFFGKAFNDIQNPYYVIINDYLVLANAQAAIEVWVDKFVVNQTLANDAYYQQFKSKQPKEGAINFYVNTNYILPWIESYTLPNYHDKINAVYEQINAVNHIGFRSIKNEDYSFNGSIELSKTTDKPTTLVWKAKLAAPCRMAPQVIDNDLDGNKSIWIQDTLNQLYFINNEGNIVWKRNVKEPILSPIYPVDYYNNQQLYFIFNTTGHIYLVDKDGNDVNSFPINLQSPATSGMLVTDFDKTKEYTLYVSCKNTNIYGYDKSGKPLEGWNPRTGMGTVMGRIKHFQKDSKDFIIAQNKENQLIMLKRNGGLRNEPIVLTGEKFSLFEYQAEKENERIATCDNFGKVYVCNFDGVGFNMSFKVGDNTDVKFSFADVTGDSKYDYNLLSNKSVASFTYKNNIVDNVFEKEFPTKLDDIFSLKIFDAKKSKIGLLCKSKKQIILLEEDGKIAKSFPLAGTTKFSIDNIFKDGSKAVVTGFDNYIYVYRL